MAVIGWVLAGTTGIAVVLAALGRSRAVATAGATSLVALLVAVVLALPVGFALFSGAIGVVGPPALLLWSIAPPAPARLALGRRQR